MKRPSWAPIDVDLEIPSGARVYDYYLGGSHNFAVDREMAHKAMELWPELPEIMQANRAFLRRAVRYVAGQAVTQFLDIGSGIPTEGNVHEILQRVSPGSRVLYVDIDPVAVAHSSALLAGVPWADVVHADLADGPEAVLAHPRARRLIDPDQPVGLLLVALLHFVPDAADPAGAVARFRDALAPGSYLALSHATHEGRPDQADSHMALYRQTSTPLTMRSRAEVAALFAGFDLVDPGLVFLPQWRPDSPSDVGGHPERFTAYAAVGRRG